MSAFFESALLFSLAVLIVLIGLLIYYFKDRVSNLEQKNLKCLEIINDVYKSHLELKHVISMQHMIGGRPVEEPRIKIELEEQYSSDEESDEDSDEESDEESENENENESEDISQIKMINVDLSGPSSMDEIDDMEIDDIEEIEDVEIDDVEIDDVEIDDINDIDESPKIVVNKLEIEGGIELSDNLLPIASSTMASSYKKMGLPALRGFIISNGYQTDSAKLQKMKKNELIDLIIESQKQ